MNVSIRCQCGGELTVEEFGYDPEGAAAALEFVRIFIHHHTCSTPLEPVREAGPVQVIEPPAWACPRCGSTNPEVRLPIAAPEVNGTKACHDLWHSQGGDGIVRVFTKAPPAGPLPTPEAMIGALDSGRYPADNPCTCVDDDHRPPGGHLPYCPLYGKRERPEPPTGVGG